MRRAVAVGSVLAVVLALVSITMTAWGQGDEDIFQAALVSRDETHLTIYESGFTLVRDTRTFELKAGLNQVDFNGVAAQIWRDSVSFVSLTDTGGTYVVGQSFATAEPPFSLDTLVVENIGQEISITLYDEENTSYTGTLLNADYTLTLRLADDSVVTVDRAMIRTYRVPNFPEERVEQPTLTLLIHCVQAGQQQLALTYLTEGLSWHHPSYALRLAADDKAVNLAGWITLSNNTTAAFENAQVTLGGSGADRLQFVAHDVEFAAIAATPTMVPTPSPDGMGGGGGGGAPMQPADFLLDLPRPVTLPAVQSVLIEFLAGADTGARNVYVYDASPRIYGYTGFITSEDYGLTGLTVVQNYLEFSTDRNGGLGIALPTGTLRIYQETEAGTSLLIGQTQLAYTPENETVQVFLEDTADITGERVRTDFQMLSVEALQETYTIRLINNGDKDLTVVVPERMTRSVNWEILGATVPYEQPDQFGVEFTVEVPAGGEAEITYTVLYTQPQ